MSEFTNFDPLNSLVPVPYSKEVLGHDHWIVTSGFEFYIGDKSDGNYIYIPKGYLTDGATVPPFLKRLVPTWGQYGAATIVHDYLCEYLSMRSKGTLMSITRARSDYIFLEAMGVLGVPWYRRFPMYFAVRLYSLLVRKDEAVLWQEKRDLEVMLEMHFEQHGDYNFPRGNHD